MTFHIHDRVRTPYGIGRYQGMEDADTAVVWIARDDYRGTEYPGKFTASSGTVAVRVSVDTLDRA